MVNGMEETMSSQRRRGGMVSPQGREGGGSQEENRTRTVLTASKKWEVKLDRTPRGLWRAQRGGVPLEGSSGNQSGEAEGRRRGERAQMLNLVSESRREEERERGRGQRDGGDT